MKIAVINYSGNVGKTTIARHLLMPRFPEAELIAVESVNADECQAQALRGRQFADLQEYLQTVNDVIVDVGASNAEDLLTLMRRYRGSHEDFDYYVVPTAPALKPQQDTIALLMDLAKLGIPSYRVRLLFNMVDDLMEWAHVFSPLVEFVTRYRGATINPECRLSHNEVYQGLRSLPGVKLMELAREDTDYKALIAEAATTAERLALAQKLALHRLAVGVLPELDTCFQALGLEASPTVPRLKPVEEVQ